MAMPLFYADLDAAWFYEGVPGLNQAFTGAGWQRLTWREDADWGKAWVDKGHPERPTAAELLARLLVQLPSGTRRVLIAGDFTLTQHFREGWDGESILYAWVERDRFLAEAGCPGSALWAIPVARCDCIAWQLWKALRWETRAFDAVLLVGGWNSREGDPVELAQLVTAATR